MRHVVIPFRRQRRAPDPERVAQFADMGRRLQREREDAGPIADRILAETGRVNLGSLTECPELRNAGVLDHLAKLISEELPRDLAYAEHLAAVAVEISERLPSAAYPEVLVKQLRVHALADLATVRRTMKQFELAIEAVERAFIILDGACLAHDQALVTIELALTYRDMGSYPVKVRELLAACANTLRDHGDEKQAARAESLTDQWVGWVESTHPRKEAPLMRPRGGWFWTGGA